MLNDYSTILNYIDFFKDSSNEFYKWHKGKEVNGVLHIGYIEYSEKVREFMKKSEDTEFLFRGNYSDWLDGKRKTPEEIIHIIKSSDLEKLRKIFTFYLRGERFCDGMLSKAIDNKIILNILLRLKELLSL